MNFMNHVPDEIKLRDFPIPFELLNDPRQRAETNIYSEGISDICNALGLNFLNQPGVWMGRVGSLRRRGDNWVFTQKPIPKQTLSAWIHGRERFPLWRAAQAIAILELIYMRMKKKALEMQVPKNDVFWLHLKIAARWIARFHREEELDRWLGVMRRGLYERLKIDQDTSEAAKQLFQDYVEYLESVGILEAAGDATGKG